MCWVVRSSAETGSSQTMSFGRSARARAIATRWRWPPENSRGRRSAASAGSLTRSSSSPTLPLASRTAVPWAIRGSIRVSPMLKDGFNEVYGSWKITWRSRLSSRRRRGAARSMRSPSKVIVPAWTGTRPRTARPIVVLPDPDSPTRPKVSAGRMSKETPFSTLVRVRRRAAKETSSPSTSSSGRSGSCMFMRSPFAVARPGGRGRGRAPRPGARGCTGRRARAGPARRCRSPRSAPRA